MTSKNYRNNKNIDFFKTFSKEIKLIGMDVDGILTDGKIYQGASSDAQVKAFNCKDGIGIRLLKKYNFKIALISGGSGECITKRAKSLGIEILEFGVKNKLDVLIKLQSKYNINANETVFLGDDINDLTVLKKVRIFATPFDGHIACKAKAHWIGEKLGGKGFVREFTDNLILGKGLDPYMPLETANDY